MKKVIAILFFTLAIAGFTGCEMYEIIPEEITEPATFTEVQAIFTKNCAGCHNGITANPVLTEGVAYTNLIGGQFINTDNPEASTLYVKMKDSSHSLYSSAGERNKVLAWIQDGAPNN